MSVLQEENQSYFAPPKAGAGVSARKSWWSNLFAGGGRSKAADVEKGASFRFADKDGKVEIATVLTLIDILDHAHVKYMLRIEGPSQVPFEDGPRVMNLQSFVKHFAEPL